MNCYFDMKYKEMDFMYISESVYDKPAESNY